MRRLYLQIDPLDQADPFWAQLGFSWLLILESARVAQGVAPRQEVAVERAREAARRYQEDYPGRYEVEEHP